MRYDTLPLFVDVDPDAGEQLTISGFLAARRLTIIVPCSAAKLGPPTADDIAAGWEGWRAGDLYTGTFHRYARQHAERLGADILILSAGHGLLELDRPTAAYDTKITDKHSIVSTPGLIAWQAAHHDLNNPARLVVSFCPAAYTAVLAAAVPGLVTPLAGASGIGDQRGRINRLTRTALGLKELDA